MESYTNFAYVYDTFMDQEPYEEWADRICRLLDTYGLPQGDISSKNPGSEARHACDGSETRPAHDGSEARPAHDGSEVRPAHDGCSVCDGRPERSSDHTVEKDRSAAGEGKSTGTVDRSMEERNIVVDLGCGTGKLTEILAARGYDMIGIDLSVDMLAIAQERRIESGSTTLYSRQDMRDFELYGAAGAMVSAGDSINYLLEESDLEDMFRCVARALLPGGVFVFDFKTVHLYRDVIGDRTIAEDRGDCAFIWDNYYHEDREINEYDLAVFVERPAMGEGCWQRFDEVHFQRGYTSRQLRTAAERAGLLWITCLDAETEKAEAEDSERLVAVVRKKFQNPR